MKKRKKIWILKDCLVSKEQYISYQEEVEVLPNLLLIKAKSVIMLTTDNVEKNYTKIITSKGREFYLNMSLCKSAEYINTDLVQINKSCYVSLRKIDKRLGFSYIFLKGSKTPLKVGKIFIEKLKDKFY